MDFFPRHCYKREVNFTPLFRLLDDFDSYSRQSSGISHDRRQPKRRWQPKFDVRETEDFYGLYGELPGVNKEDVDIHFTEPRTLVVLGRSERSYTAGNEPSADDETECAATPDTISANGEEPRGSPHRATVEDESESDDGNDSFEVVEKENKTSGVVEKKRPDHADAADTAKYWLSERSIGDFTRTFTFPQRVDQDAVEASFQDGILTVIVPKAKPYEPQRIAVN
ncbi:heat shock protein [Purpureocillium lavendulum]|uniref:Heat shock protein n=1 Tax=Purpureocillium lavendulum TaxID=1247861 RepID=A0AB34G5C3_9HYPO|nr:heat shock protein [Purpureocillium lavendulum]